MQTVEDSSNNWGISKGNMLSFNLHVFDTSSSSFKAQVMSISKPAENAKTSNDEYLLL